MLLPNCLMDARIAKISLKNRAYSTTKTRALHCGLLPNESKLRRIDVLWGTCGFGVGLSAWFEHPLF